MRLRTLALSLCIALPAALAHAAAPVSTFTANDESWLIADFYTANTYTTPDALYTPNYAATGGNPGGFINFYDPSNGSFFFEAPKSFVGNLASYFGGTLSYSEKVTAPAGYGEWRGDPDVVLVANGNVYTYQLSANPGSTWTNLAVTLDGKGWTKDSLFGAPVSSTTFQQDLSKVTALYIRGEMVAGVVENAALDNVQLTAAVPEPETYAMLLAGLGLVGWMARRARA